MLTELPDINDENVEVEVIEHAAAATERRCAARRVTLQVLYELDCVAHPLTEVIAARLKEEQCRAKLNRYVRLLRRRNRKSARARCFHPALCVRISTRSSCDS